MATDTNLSKLTPEEFTNFFMEGLKQELSTYELQANKVGFLGYLVNMLGNITYDAKIYKDMLFKEAFPATAQQDDNIYLHGSIYGYKNSLATPAVAHGTIQFDFSLLPAISASTIKQEVILGGKRSALEIGNSSGTDFPTQINVDNIIFSTKSIYRFVRERNSYRTVVSRYDGTVSTYPSSSPILTVEFDNFKQERPEIIEFTLPSYNYGSYYTYTFTVDDEYISDIHVFIKMPGDTDPVEYDVEKVKYLIGPSARTVFFNQVASDTYEIEFGSGVHGAWVPGAEVQISLYKTIGVAANFSQDVSAVVNYPTQLMVFNTNADGTRTSIDPIATTVGTDEYLKVNFKYSEGGVDPLAGEDLRRALVDYIQTRDNFLSEADFYNIIEKYTTDFRLLFKKMLVQENVFYLQRAFRDEYQNIVRSRNLLPEVFSSTTGFNNIRFYSRDTGSLVPDSYYYRIFAEDRFGNIVGTEDITASLIPESTETGSIYIEWNPIPGAIKYRIFGRTSGYELLWEQTEHSFVDTGSNSAAVENEGGIPEFEKNPYVIFPDFYSNTGEHFVSPFMYKFNDFYNYYEGWLFYPDLLVHFSSLSTTAYGEFNSASIPSIYFNLIYDNVLKQTTINLKSYQKITEWTFGLSIPELGIGQKDPEPMLMLPGDDSTFYYVYKENHGLIINPITLNITARRNGMDVFTGKTPEVSQRHDTTDLLQVPVFKYSDVPYLVDVPVLDYDEFHSNETLYLDKIRSFLNAFNFEENRMISDSLQFRMLNTDSIHSYLLVNSLVQGKDLYIGLNFVNNQNIISIADSPERIPMNNDSWIIKGTPVQILATEVDGDSLSIYSGIGYGGMKDSLTYLNESPYSIIIDGDYSDKISTRDVIRVKDASTPGINGVYHVVSSKFDSGFTTVYVVEKIVQSSNEGILYFATYEQWRKGGPDNIATWNLSEQVWTFTDINVNDIVTVSKPVHETYRYSSEYKFVDYILRFPLNLSIRIYADRDAVSRYGVNLEDQKKQIKLEVAKYLQLYMSGTDIVYYPSAIVEFILEPRRVWMKGIVVRTFDSSNPPFEFKNGIETYPEYKIRDNISSSKMEILKYNSAFFWWNVENIEIKYDLGE